MRLPLGSQWGHDYLEHIRNFCERAGLGVFENDGSYPGDRCAATDHPYHHGLEDSQWVQWRAITDLYQWCTGHGVHLNIPDWYFLAGGTKTGMGYREGDWSLPRAEQELIERQNMFDGTWNKTASMGWMFVPLSQYHGGGAAATIEPLHEHLDHYEARLADLLGYGVQACWRGPRLFDTDETKAVVQKWVAFYKAHRQVCRWRYHPSPTAQWPRTGMESFMSIHKVARKGWPSSTTLLTKIWSARSAYRCITPAWLGRLV